MKTCFIILILLSLLPRYGFSQTKEVLVNAKTNCCIGLDMNKENCLKKAAKLQLDPGKYLIKPINGAISRYPSDNAAILRKTKPWLLLVLVYDGNKIDVIGDEVKYTSKQDA
ncbi:MAG: hypothetical protein ACLGQH_14595, partial [Acidobacteriota bacterium]